MGKLTDLKVRNLKPLDKDKAYCDGQGLYIRVRKSGSKKWIIRRKQAGKTIITTIGEYPGISLKEARYKAAEFKLKKSVNTVTVEMLVEKYMKEVIEKEHRRPELTDGYMRRAVLPTIGNRRVQDLDRSDLVTIVQQYSKRGARTADQLRSNIKKLFAYAVELGIIGSNPMNDVSRRVAGYIPVSRSRVLNDDEIRLIWSLDKQNARVLRFLLLTGLRIGEAQKGIREGHRWIVEASLSKNERPHWAHLTDTAMQQLPLPKCTATNIQAWLRRLLDNHGVSPRFTPHDLRRTAATRMADNCVQPFIVERVLNHRLEGVMAVYNRAEYEEERINAAITLEKHILQIVGSV